LRIKGITVRERPSIAICVVSEHAAGVGRRLARERITKHTAVNASDLIESCFYAIPWRLGKEHWVIGRRHYRIEIFLVRRIRTGGWNADSRRDAYVWIVAKEPIVSVVWQAILTNIAGTHAKPWGIMFRRLDVKSRRKLGRGLKFCRPGVAG
jgi:hypothetical protein